MIISFEKNKMNVHCNNLKEDTIKQMNYEKNRDDNYNLITVDWFWIINLRNFFFCDF